MTSVPLGISWIVLGNKGKTLHSCGKVQRMYLIIKEYYRWKKAPNLVYTRRKTVQNKQEIYFFILHPWLDMIQTRVLFTGCLKSYRFKSALEIKDCYFMLCVSTYTMLTICERVVISLRPTHVRFRVFWLSTQLWILKTWSSQITASLSHVYTFSNSEV